MTLGEGAGAPPTQHQDAPDKLPEPPDTPIIAEQRPVERERLQSGEENDERYRIILETATEGICTIGEHDIVTLANNALAEMLGYEPGEMVGRSVSEFMDPAVLEQARDGLRRRKEGIAERLEYLLRAKDGHEVWTLMASSPLYDREGTYTGVLSMVTDISARKAAESENLRAQQTILQQALYDGLTGLPNRALFLDRVTDALARNQRDDQAVAVLFIDLDQFKLINDSLGHEAGNELLRLLAPRLASAVRPGDTLARLGGDVFAALCEHLPSDSIATVIANQLLVSLEEPVVLNGEEHVMSASIGIAIAAGESTPTDLLRDADAAMYQAKAAGRGRAKVFDGKMRARVLGRVRTESALRAALANGEGIYIEYQPLVSLRGGQMVGAEALARWRHPEWGSVSPVEFVPVAEDTGLIHQLGAYVMRRAAQDCAAWQGHSGFAGIAVNVSTRQLVVADEVLTLLRDVTTAEGIAPGFLTLEITESVLIEQLDVARETLDSLHGLGFSLSLDDFGTGYSSLSYLANLPFDSVKIDRSLIRDVVDVPRSAALAAAIVQMGHALELRVIAEGVETPQQAARLKALGCDIAQGTYFAPPMAAKVLSSTLKDRASSSPASRRPPLPTQRTQSRIGKARRPATPSSPS